MSRLLSLAHLTVLDADPLALIEAAAAGGFDAIGLRIVPPFVTETIVPVVGDADLQRRIKQRLRDSDIALLVSRRSGLSRKVIEEIGPRSKPAPSLAPSMS